jgi:3',5'-cyclic AMP phosphodiesterase CpdA
MTDTFTLAHLSDAHLPPITGFAPRYWNAKRALGWLNWMRGRQFVHRRDVADRITADMRSQAPDHIAVTGDLMNLGLPGEASAARSWLEGLGRPENVTVIPGNHDIYTTPGEAACLSEWTEYMQANGASGTAGAAAAFPFVREVGPLVLIALNSAHPTPPFVASGRLGGAQLAGLAERLNHYRASGRPRVVLIHHPPLSGQAKPSRALADTAEMEQVLSAHGAELVLHGHNHADMLAWHRGASTPVPVLGVASASAGRRHKSEPLARYQLLRFRRAEKGWSIERELRGLTEPGGAVGSVERSVLVPDAA